jgi:hypothetical protein
VVSWSGFWSGVCERGYEFVYVGERVSVCVRVCVEEECAAHSIASLIKQHICIFRNNFLVRNARPHAVIEYRPGFTLPNRRLRGVAAGC